MKYAENVAITIIHTGGGERCGSHIGSSDGNAKVAAADSPTAASSQKERDRVIAPRPATAMARTNIATPAGYPGPSR